MGIAEIMAISMRATAKILAIAFLACALLACGKAAAIEADSGHRTGSSLFALNVKSAVAGSRPATVTFWVCVPYSSCHAVTV